MTNTDRGQLLADMWRRGFDTVSIAGVIGVSEAAIYNNLEQIKENPMELAREFKGGTSVDDWWKFCKKQDDKACRIMGKVISPPKEEPKEPEAEPVNIESKPCVSAEAAKRGFTRGVWLALLSSPTWKSILYEVTAQHGITMDEITSPGRKRKAVAAREHAVYRMRTELLMSLPAIGRRLGGRDHTTIMHNLRRYCERNPHMPEPPSYPARQTHCLNGHEYTQEDTHTRSNGSRYCLICVREKRRALHPATE